MRYRAVLAIAMLTIVGSTATAEEEARFSLVFGPRVGATYVATTAEEFTSLLRENSVYTGSYIPVVSLFGFNLEERVLLGETESHFAFQQIVYVLGIEQSIAIPAGAFLIGYRGGGGFEFGLGPVATATGVGMVVAVGYTFASRGVFVPVDVSVVLPNQQAPARISITTGFNFVIDADLNL